MNDASVEKMLFVYIQYWLMHSTYTKDKSVYVNKRKELIKKYTVEKIQEIEIKVLEGHTFNKFLSNFGVEKKIRL